MEATRALVSIKPGPGMVSTFDVLDAAYDGNIELAVQYLCAVVENVEVAIAARLAQLEQ